MKTFVLVLLVGIYGRVAITTQEFSNEQACEAAGKKFEEVAEKTTGNNVWVSRTCSPKE